MKFALVRKGLHMLRRLPNAKGDLHKERSFSYTDRKNTSVFLKNSSTNSRDVFPKVIKMSKLDSRASDYSNWLVGFVFPIEIKRLLGVP